jgi:hypothetical protein
LFLYLEVIITWPGSAYWILLTVWLVAAILGMNRVNADLLTSFSSRDQPPLRRSSQ